MSRCACPSSTSLRRSRARRITASAARKSSFRGISETRSTRLEADHAPARARLYVTHAPALLHMEDLHELNWDLLGQDYDGYDGDGPPGGISERMIATGLGERGSLDIPLDVWNANIPTRLIWDIRSLKSGPNRGRFDVWQPSLHTKSMIGVLVDDGFLCRDPTCLAAPEGEDLTDNVSAFVKPKNDVNCYFIIDMRNLNDWSKVQLRKVKLPSIHTVFQTIQREIHRGAPL